MIDLCLSVGEARQRDVEAVLPMVARPGGIRPMWRCWDIH